MLCNNCDVTKPPLLSPRAQNLLLILACLLPLVAYHRSFGASFVFDDHFLIVRNPNIHSLHNWTALFFEPMWNFVRNATLVYYRPVTLLFFSLEYHLFGDQPLGWHVVSVFLHVIVTGLVFWTGNAVLKNRAAAIFAALLFGVYPIHTEVACWAVATNESLLAIAVLAAFGGFVFWHEQPRSAVWFCFSFISTAAALLIKETAVILPVLLFSYAFIRHHGAAAWGRRIVQASLYAGPYALLCATILFIRSQVLHRSVGSQTQISDLVMYFPSVTLLDIRQLLWPFRLSLFYNPVPALSVGVATALAVLFSVVVVGMLVWCYRRYPVLAFLLFWTAISLLPTMLVTTPNGKVADRFLYLASVAVCWAGGWLIAWAASGPRRVRMYALAAAGVVVVTFTLTSYVASGYWKDSMSLFERGAHVAPRNAIALTGYAGGLLSHGRKDEAIATLHQALVLDPDNWLALYKMGLTEVGLGELNAAEEHLVRAESPVVRGETAEFLLTHPLRASIAIRLRDWDKAQQLLRETLAVAPDNKMLQEELAYCVQNASQASQVRAKQVTRSE